MRARRRPLVNIWREPTSERQQHSNRGFAIGGSTAETVLIRAWDRADDVFGLTGTLAQPVLTLFNNSGAIIYSNTVWGDATIAPSSPRSAPST